MNINNLGGALVQRLAGVQDVALLGVKTAAEAGQSPTGDSAAISGPAKFFQQLQQLRDQPEKLGPVLTGVAERIQAAAQVQPPGSAEEQYLSGLAGKFQEVARSGDVSQLQPLSASGNRVLEAYTLGSGKASDSVMQLPGAANLPLSAGAATGAKAAEDNLIDQLSRHLPERIAGMPGIPFPGPW